MARAVTEARRIIKRLERIQEQLQELAREAEAEGAWGAHVEYGDAATEIADAVYHVTQAARERQKMVF